MSNVTRFPTENHRTDWIENFISMFHTLDIKILSVLPYLYHDKVHYLSPLAEVKGLPGLLRYSKQAFESVQACEFTVTDKLVMENRAAIYWRLLLQHKAIYQGRPIELEGHSFLQQHDGLITFHRDYFDSGQLIYERLPVLGTAVRWYKARKL